MARFVGCCGRQSGLPRALGVLGIALIAAAGGIGAAAAEPATTRPGAPQRSVIPVQLDQAKIIKVPERTATLVVGNPLIADVTVQAGGTLVITGKSYGVTNLVAIDRAGQILMENTLEVQGPGGALVVVYRGVDRETYSCTPECDRRITLGDTAAYFTATLDQTDKFAKQAQDTQKK